MPDPPSYSARDNIVDPRTLPGLDLAEHLSDRLDALSVAGAGGAAAAASGPSGGNDLTALQASCDALGAAGGGDLYVRPGLYLLDAPLVVPGGVTLRGGGIEYAYRSSISAPVNGAIFRATQAMPCVVQLGNGAAFPPNTDVDTFDPEDSLASMVGCVIDGAGLADAAVLTNGRRNYIDFCQITRGLLYGLQLQGQNGYVTRSVIAQGGVGDGIYCQNWDNKVVECQVRDSAGYLVHLRPGATGFELRNSHLYNVTGGDALVRLTSDGTGTCDNVSIVGNVIEHGASHKILIVPFSSQAIRNVLIASNLFYQGSAGFSAESFSMVAINTASAVVRTVNITGNTVISMATAGNKDFQALLNCSGLVGNLSNVQLTNNTGENVNSIRTGNAPTRVHGNTIRNGAGTLVRDEHAGRATLNGDGSSPVFTIAHGLDGTPSSVIVTPGHADARGPFHVTADGTNITVTYQTAPVAGTGNVVLNWQGRL